MSECTIVGINVPFNQIAMPPRAAVAILTEHMLILGRNPNATCKVVGGGMPAVELPLGPLDALCILRDEEARQKIRSAPAIAA